MIRGIINLCSISTGGDFCGVEFVEVIWNIVSIIMDNQAVKAVELHDVLHGLQENWGIGTTSLEEKLLHQLVSMKHKVLYEILLDIHKAYDMMY